jgi:outer membrane protein TolC
MKIANAARLPKALVVALAAAGGCRSTPPQAAATGTLAATATAAATSATAFATTATSKPRASEASSQSNVAASELIRPSSVATAAGAAAAVLAAPSSRAIRLASATADPPEPIDAMTKAKRGLSLEEAVDQALANNPDLLTQRAAEGVSRAKLGVARTYPFNPVLNYDVRPATRERTGETGSTLTMVAVTQEVELAHQRRYRRWAGSADLSNVSWTVRHAELVAMAQAERLFFTALYFRELRDSARSSAELSANMVEVLKRRLDAGQSGTSDVAVGEIELMAQRRQAALADSAYASAVADLRRHLGQGDGEGVEPLGSLGQWQWQPLSDRPGAERDSARFEAAALASARPDVQAARAAADAAAAQYQLARANQIPNLTIGPVFERDEAGTTFYGVEGSLPIMVRDTGRALVDQRMAELSAAQIAAEQLQRKGELEIQDALDRYRRALRSTTILRQHAVEDLSKYVRQVEEQFKAGQTDMLRVYAARASLLAARRGELDALNELTQAAALVSEVTGLPPAALLSSSRPLPSP